MYVVWPETLVPAARIFRQVLHEAAAAASL